MIFEVNGYIDESTLSQLDTNCELPAVIRLFLKSLNLLNNNKNISINLFRSKKLLFKTLKCQTTFRCALNKSVPKDLKVELLKQILQMSKEWEENRVHSSGDYFEFAGECCTDDTLAEISEQNLGSSHNQLITFNSINSSTLPYIGIYKDENIVPIIVDVLSTKAAFDEWIQSHFSLSALVYIGTEDTPPKDSQTMLKNKILFRETSFINQGRVVYEEIMTRRYYCVDNLHYGQTAHIEVWDKRGGYLGEIDLHGEVGITPPTKGQSKNNPTWLN